MSLPKATTSNAIFRTDILGTNAKISSSIVVPVKKIMGGVKNPVPTTYTPVLPTGAMAVNQLDARLYYSDGVVWEQVISTPAPFAKNPPIGSYLVGDGESLTQGPYVGNDSSINLGLNSLSNGGLTTTDCIAMGNLALSEDTTGINNIGIGTQAGNDITTGSDNIIIGVNSTAGSNTASNRIVIGNATEGVVDSSLTIGGITSIYAKGLQAIKTGTILYYNPANGLISYEEGTGVVAEVFTGTPLSGVGSFADPVTIANGTAHGQYLGYNSTSSKWVLSPSTELTPSATNLALGSNAMNGTTTGLDNLAIGTNTLDILTSGSRNLSLGNDSLGSMKSGDDNVAIGHEALLQATGNENTCVGSEVGADVTTGSQNVLIGTRVKAGSATATNRVVIGYQAEGKADNALTVSTAGFYMPSLSSATSSNLVYFNSVTGQITQSSFSVGTQVYAYVLASGTVSGSVPAGSAVVPLNTATSGNLNGLSTALGVNSIIFQPGRYHIRVDISTGAIGNFRVITNSLSGDPILLFGNSSSAGHCMLSGFAAISVATELQFLMTFQNPVTDTAWGFAVSDGDDEVYNVVTISKLL